MSRVVLLRHGESIWNRENRFTGWTDVDLSKEGICEAQRAGRILAKNRYEFDVCYTSVLRRAIKTLWIVLEETDLMWLPVHRSWRLNERHYGALQGRYKDEVRREVDKEQFHAWRRGFADRPPPLEPEDPRSPLNDAHYAAVDPDELPNTESLRDTQTRMLPYWRDVILPQVKQRKHVLISGHGNDLRALVKHLSGISDEAISRFEIPTGAVLVYEFDEGLRPMTLFYEYPPGRPAPW